MTVGAPANFHSSTIQQNPVSMESLWITSNFQDFKGSSSMISFENGFGSEEACDDECDRRFLRSGKKHRLSGDQVRFLEKSFELESKLEPERKARIAKELFLEPRQVAIWFQNRRARFKTKRLEKDYDLLKSGFDELGSKCDELAKEVQKLKEEVLFLKNKLVPSIAPVNVVAPVVLTAKQEDASSMKSDALLSDGSDCAAHANSVSERTADSLRVFESDVDDDDSFSRSFLSEPPITLYQSKLEENSRDVSYCFGLNVDHQIFCLWP